MSRWTRLAGCGMALVCFGATGRPVASSTEALLHVRLRSSNPADGDTLADAPARVRLEFTQVVDPKTSRASLVSADATHALEPHNDVADSRVLVAALPHLSDGGYRISWSVVSPDGHPVSGDFVFYVLTSASAAGPRPAFKPPPLQETSGVGIPPVTAVLRGLAAGVQLALTGLLGFLLALGGDARLRRVAVILASVAPVLIASHLAAWIILLEPPQADLGNWVWATLAGPGRLEVARLSAALLALWGLGLARMPKLAFLLAGVSVLAAALIGHAVSFHPAWNVPAKAIHLAGVAAWLGGLLVLVLTERTAADYPVRARRVSGVALAAFIAVAVTGVVQTLAVMPEVSQWFGSRYGGFVLAKVAGLAGLAGFAAYHRFRLLPRLAGDAGRLRQSVRRELTLMGFVIALAGILGYISPPEPADTATLSAPHVEELSQ